MFTARTFPESGAVVTDRSTAERMNNGNIRNHELKCL